MHAHHESKLEQAAEAVSQQRKQVEEIRTAIAEQEKIVSGSELRRQPFVLQAARGDVAAKTALDKLLHEDLAAERTLSDLRLALPQAEAELRTAENAQRAAGSELRKAEKNRLARQRCAVAEKIDAALAAFSSAWVEYEQLGRQLYSVSDDFPNQVYLLEQFDGLVRLAAALPHQPFFDLRHKHSFAPLGRGQPLAVSERQFWRLPASDEVKAA
jgi:hypothetical protein